MKDIIQSLISQINKMKGKLAAISGFLQYL